MLDDNNVLQQRDPSDALGVAARQFEQAEFDPQVSSPDHDGRDIKNVVIAGMGGSTLGALVLKSLLKNQLSVPLEVVRSYSLPSYVSENTLVIVSSYSGNTEEALSALTDARGRNAQVAIVAAGGQLAGSAANNNIAHVMQPSGYPPRITIIHGLISLLTLLEHFGVIGAELIDEVHQTRDFLRETSRAWNKDITVDKNYAKQLALQAVGKTPVFYGGELTAPLAYKWKISWNENAKNVAFWNEYPEFNHNEFMGWVSHPIEKPFAVFDLVSSFEHSQILKRFEVSDRLLSGRRPKATVVELHGDTPLKQLLWGCVLADFVSIYVAILNGVDPTPVELIEKLKAELK